MAQHTLTGLFKTRPDAERAVEYLVQHFDLDRNAVRVQAAGSENVTAGTHDRRAEGHEAQPEHAGASGGGREGMITVSAEVPEGHMNEALRAFRENNAVELKDARGKAPAGGGGDPAR
jgi:hypothetical protein